MQTLPAPITTRQPNALIDELRMKPVPVSAEPEDLSLPLDPDIRVTTNLPRHKVELLIDEQTVSWLSIIDHQQYIGGQPIHLGGIAGCARMNSIVSRGSRAG